MEHASDFVVGLFPLGNGTGTSFYATAQFSSDDYGSQFRYNKTRYQYETNATAFVSGLDPSRAANITNAKWAKNNANSSRHEARETFLKEFEDAEAKMLWNWRTSTSIMDYSSCFSKDEWHPNFEKVDFKEANESSYMFCNSRIRGIFNLTDYEFTEVTIYTGVKNGTKMRNGTRASSLVQSTMVSSSNRTISIAIGADNDVFINEHSIQNFFEGVTVEDRIKDCVNQFSNLLNSVSSSTLNHISPSLC